MTLPTTGIEGIESITFSTEQWRESERFYADWGLTNILVNRNAQTWETLNGAKVHVVKPEATGFAPAFEAGPTLREVSWGVCRLADLDELHRKLSQLNPPKESLQDLRSSNTPSLVAIDTDGLQIRFEVSRKKPLALKGAQMNPWGAAQRIDAPSPIYQRAAPVEIGHVVLFTQNLLRAEQFYQALGFTVSDRYPGRGSFLRCSIEGGHHDLFLLQVPGKAKGLNHVAFTVRDIHEMFGGGLHMDRCGWKTQLGPGRHPISSAYFWYFENPCGGLIEYNADEDHLTAAWQPRSFEPGPTVFAEWAVDGGIDGLSRRQKNGPAAVTGKFLTEKK